MGENSSGIPKYIHAYLNILLNISCFVTPLGPQEDFEKFFNVFVYNIFCGFQDEGVFVSWLTQLSKQSMDFALTITAPNYLVSKTNKSWPLEIVLICQRKKKNEKRHGKRQTSGIKYQKPTSK